MSEIEKLKTLFYDPSSGYVNVNSLAKKAKEMGIKLSYTQIRTWYNKQDVNQIFKENLKPKKLHPILSPFGTVGNLQMDLRDVSKFSRKNKGVNFILTIIDVFSRYLWCYPLKRKSGPLVAEAIDSMLNEFEKIHKKLFINITTDKGSEFSNKLVKKVFDKHGVFKHYIKDPNIQSNTTAVVERVHRTMFNRIKKIMYAKNNLNFVDALAEVVTNYNNTEHSTVGKKPIDIYNGRSLPMNIFPDEIIDTIKVGDIVRVKRKLTNFQKKGFENTTTTARFKVIEKIGNKYRIQNLTTEHPLKTLYLERQLIIIPSDTEKTPTIAETKKDIIIEKKNKTQIRRLRKEGLHPVDKDGNYIIHRALIPKTVDEPVKQPKRRILKRRQKPIEPIPIIQPAKKKKVIFIPRGSVVRDPSKPKRRIVKRKPKE